ncbi:YdeI/OmpD-associated family protein [Stieleria sp. JC731]|uniref:DUF1801 domain-containing protein n=1 Tax=Pirellulaceae TaxID=2691357 RepID=UPI001E5DA1D6|nr:YdeI/OmpD-associated family protein [Stieleria sp. JC731]MCC9601308.1 YdeI/OmpD-associated family protein [Stieleria sp. JC731]
MPKVHPKVSEFIKKDSNWRKEIRTLRSILVDSGLTEDFKWRAPCYTFENSNIAIIARLKDSCTLSFFKGILLNDEAKVLVAPGKNSQSARVIRFFSEEEIHSHTDTIRSYVQQAIEIEQSGKKVDFSQKDNLEIPKELQQTYDENPLLQAAFESLTPGRQRGYILHFTGAKQSRTRKDRVEKSVDRIMAGKGIHDCICGLSSRLPRCDGSHQSLRK